MNFKNLALGYVATAPSPATTGTSLVLDSGEGARFPQPSTDGNFYVTAMPPGENPHSDNSEILLVTARSTDTLTIVREQGDTTAKTIEAGWIILQSIYKENILDEDDMASDSATALATQRSIKAYSDSATQTQTNKTLINPTINFTNKAPTSNVRCDVTLSADQTGVVPTTNTIVAFNSENIDTGSDFNTTTYKYTAPVAGTYLVSWGVRWKQPTADKRLIVSLAKNDVEQTNFVAECFASAASLYPSVASSRLMELSANDTLHVIAYHNAAGNLTIYRSGTYLSIHLLST